MGAKGGARAGRQSAQPGSGALPRSLSRLVMALDKMRSGVSLEWGLQGWGPRPLWPPSLCSPPLCAALSVHLSLQRLEDASSSPSQAEAPPDRRVGLRGAGQSGRGGWAGGTMDSSD